MAPTHFACYCPKDSDCQYSGKRLGWCDSESEARTKVYNHLQGHYHELSADEAGELASKARLDTWGPSDFDQTKSKAHAGDAADDQEKRQSQPWKKQRQQQSLQDATSGGSSASDSFGSRAELISRAQTSEQQLETLNGIMTRVIEHVTKAVASMQTGAMFARGAATAFDAEHHHLNMALQELQAMYSPLQHEQQRGLR